MSKSTPARILVIDDDEAMRDTLADGLRDHGYVVSTSGPELAPSQVRSREHDVVVTDLRMAEHDGIGLLGLSKQIEPERPVIVMTAFGAVDTAVESLRKGAYHYLLKPFKLGELELVIGRALEERALRQETRSLRKALRDRHALDQLVVQSAAMRSVCDLIERLADAEVPTLLTGETGTGKGMFARALHAEGSRAANPFVTVNCAALPENLLESELFGHVRGAFTGAHVARAGLFEQADGGVLFLDEIGDMPIALQAKLLDVLERRCIRPLGSSRERQVDVRIVAASHRDLRRGVAEGSFREDLLYRLEGVVVEIPPLRERRDDIPPLVTRFLAAARSTNARAVVERFSADAMRRLLEHSWPGNVRELENAVGRVVLLGRSPEATIDDLPATVAVRAPATAPIDFGADVAPMRQLQRRYAAWAFERLGGRKNLTCEQLEIDVKTLNRWLAADDAPPS